MLYSRVSMQNPIELKTYFSTNSIKNRDKSYKKDIQHDIFLERRAKRKRRGLKVGRKYENRVPKQYKVYIKSIWWTRRKNRYYRDNGKRCEICKSARFIDLHHKVYKNYGFEKDSDLIPLCRDHHEGFHVEYGVKGNMRAQTDEYVMSALFNEEVAEMLKNL